jgi:hypothetical protein
MSATGSVNLIVCFSSCHPFAPREAENLRQLVSLQPCHLASCHLVRHQFRVVILSGVVCREGSLPSHDSRLKASNRARPSYQDDFETPGISPRSASPRKHKRQMPNLRRNARGRPHKLQRLCLRVENFGFFTSSGF